MSPTNSNQTKKVPQPTAPPTRIKYLLESRSLLDAAGMLCRIASSKLTSKTSEPALDGRAIILLPGFASDSRYLKPLGNFLTNHGYQTEDWGMGTNLAGMNHKHKLEDLSDGWNIDPKDNYNPKTYKGEGGVAYLCDLVTARIKQRARELDDPVILLGWSLGGYIAREVARDLPDQVAQIITLGAPVVGGPKYTAAARFFIKKGLDLDWIESESSKRDTKPIRQPITAIYSQTDAIVDWRAAIDNVSPNVKHIHVNASHLGMGFNHKIWQHILAALESSQSSSEGSTPAP